MRALVLLALALVLGGCPPASEKKPPAPTTCSKVGQQCEFAPGKLGACVRRDDCRADDSSCFSCQSQH